MFRCGLKVSISLSKLINQKSNRSICCFTNLLQAETRQMDELKNNPYYSKYAAKLEEVKRTRPDEFQQKVDDMMKMKKSLNTTTSTNDDVKTIDVKNKLESIMNIDLLKEKSQEDIATIWRDYHKEKLCIYATLEAGEYNDIKSKTCQFPNFIYPVPRHGGYEFFVQKWIDDSCHFTPLINYQQNKINAQTCLTIHHYTDLAVSKDIVLMRGFSDPKILSVYECQLLALQVKMYYGLNSGLKFNLVRMFNNNPESFRHMDLVVEFENYKKDILIKREFMGTPV